MVLDCDNLDSTLKSLCQIFKISQERLIKFLLDIDLNKIYEKNTFDETPDYILLELLYKYDKVNLEYDNSFWFHNTRVMKNSTFEEGILPLKESLPLLKKFLKDLSKEIPEPLEKTGNPCSNSSHLVALKTQNKSLGGPFGYLIKQAAIDQLDINHNYLEIPEIVEDIIRSKYYDVQNEIKSLYLKHTDSYIVKFISTLNNERYLGTALYYVYKKLKNQSLCLNSNTCFDNKGEIIQSSRIEKIELYKKLFN